jgi:hypothetical protein
MGMVCQSVCERCDLQLRHALAWGGHSGHLRRILSAWTSFVILQTTAKLIKFYEDCLNDPPKQGRGAVADHTSRRPTDRPSPSAANPPHVPNVKERANLREQNCTTKCQRANRWDLQAIRRTGPHPFVCRSSHRGHLEVVWALVEAGAATPPRKPVLPPSDIYGKSDRQRCGPVRRIATIDKVPYTFENLYRPVRNSHSESEPWQWVMA